MSSDFVGMGGALTVCLIALSIVFIALAIMAGVISLVGRLAGDKNGIPEATTSSSAITATVQSSDDEDQEIAAVVMGALSAELSRVDGQVKLAAGQSSSWRLASLQEAVKRGRLK